MFKKEYKNFEGSGKNFLIKVHDDLFNNFLKDKFDDFLAQLSKLVKSHPELFEDEKKIEIEFLSEEEFSLGIQFDYTRSKRRPAYFRVNTQYYSKNYQSNFVSI